MSSRILAPFPYFTDRAGNALNGGMVFIGVAGVDPASAPQQVFWDSELSIPAAQPLRTNGGYIYRNGAPAKFYVASQYSIAVHNSLNERIAVSLNDGGPADGLTVSNGQVLQIQAGGAVSMADGSSFLFGDAEGVGATFVIASNARFQGDIIPATDAESSLGSESLRWLNLHAASVKAEAVESVSSLIEEVNGQKIVAYKDDPTPANQTEMMALDMNKCILASGHWDGSALVNAFNASSCESTTEGPGKYRITLTQAVPDDAVVIITRRGTGSNRLVAGSSHGDVMPGSSGLIVRARVYSFILGGSPSTIDTSFSDQPFHFMVVGPPRTKPTSPF